MSRQMSLYVVGADYPNRRGGGGHGGGNRRFEILLCSPGEPVALVPEPRNPVDPNAVMVLSTRDVQIGYLTAERAPWIGGMLRSGRVVRAVFQGPTSAGAAIRVAFDGEGPVLPAAAVAEPHADDDSGFWPDVIPSDD